MRAVRLILALLVLVLAFQPAVARSDEARIVTREEIAAAPELLPEAELPPVFSREVGALNGRFLLLNMHGMLFHYDLRDAREDITYAAWLNAGRTWGGFVVGYVQINWEAKTGFEKEYGVQSAVVAVVFALVVYLQFYGAKLRARQGPMHFKTQ